MTKAQISAMIFALFLWANFSFLKADEAPQKPPKFYEPPHLYWEGERKDPFSLKIPYFLDGSLKINAQNELEFLKSLLVHLNIPISSQLLLYSSTSLQLSKISINNPRAIYFNETVSVGFIPGGKIEIISIDPKLGAVFYIFDIPKSGKNIQITPTKRCMNCHAGHDNFRVPGLLIESVVVGPKGGSLDSFRTGFPGHHVPYTDRLGGWVLTDHQNNMTFRANQMASFQEKRLRVLPIDLEKLPLHNYPHNKSDLLTHLIFEHQAGFINRCIKAVYYRRLDQTIPEFKELYQKSVIDIINYAQFKDEPELPTPIQSSQLFEKDFHNQRPSILKTLDLSKRLFKYPCSYMITSEYFKSLPEDLIELIVTQIKQDLASHPDHSIVLDELKSQFN